MAIPGCKPYRRHALHDAVHGKYAKNLRAGKQSPPRVFYRRVSAVWRLDKASPQVGNLAPFVASRAGKGSPRCTALGLWFEFLTSLMQIGFCVPTEIGLWSVPNVTALMTSGYL
jgi:hypothetical protein